MEAVLRPTNRIYVGNAQIDFLTHLYRSLCMRLAEICIPNYDASNLFSDKRLADYVCVRHCVIYHLAQYYHPRLIAKASQKDRTTVLYAIKRISDLIKSRDKIALFVYSKLQLLIHINNEKKDYYQSNCLDYHIHDDKFPFTPYNKNIIGIINNDI